MNEIAAQFKNFRIKRQQEKTAKNTKKIKIQKQQENSNMKWTRKIMRPHQLPETSANPRLAFHLPSAHTLTYL